MSISAPVIRFFIRNINRTGVTVVRPKRLLRADLSTLRRPIDKFVRSRARSKTSENVAETLRGKRTHGTGRDDCPDTRIIDVSSKTSWNPRVSERNNRSDGEFLPEDHKRRRVVASSEFFERYAPARGTCVETLTGNMIRNTRARNKPIKKTVPPGQS